MQLLDWVVLLIVAGLCAALGQAISCYSRGGCLVSIALGFIGALVGMWLARMLTLPELFALEIGTTRFPSSGRLSARLRSLRCSAFSRVAAFDSGKFSASRMTARCASL
jgi:uncharacterized membrane protein YeaQ/YmgE (transglycosylase-associated protein family)